MASKEKPERENIIATSVDNDMLRKLKERAKAEQRSAATILRRALSKYLDTALPE